jgi:hypothetical protein
VILVAHSWASAQGLNIPAKKFGISFGNSPEFTGLRFNFRDRNVEKINGLNLTIWRPYDNWEGDELGSRVSGLSVGLPFTGGGSVHGLNTALVGIQAGKSLAGINLSGIGMGASGKVSGINLAGIGIGAGQDVAGINGAFIGIGSGRDVMGINVAGIGVGSGRGVYGLNLAGIGVGAAEEISGISIAGIGLGSGGNVSGSAWPGWAWVQATTCRA